MKNIIDFSLTSNFIITSKLQFYLINTVQLILYNGFILFIVQTQICLGRDNFTSFLLGCLRQHIYMIEGQVKELGILVEIVFGRSSERIRNSS